MSRIEHIGDATLYLGDCRDILPTLSGAPAADPAEARIVELFAEPTP